MHILAWGDGNDETEILDLCHFLTAMGARIAGAGTNNIMIEGVENLHGTEYTPIPDRIEAGTLACAAALTDGHVLLTGARCDHMRALLFKLSESGIICQEDDIPWKPAPFLIPASPPICRRR